MSFNESEKNKRWNDLDMQCYRGLLKKNQAIQDLETWLNDLTSAKFNPANVTQDNWSEYIDSDYKQFVYIQPQVVGYATIPFSLKGVISTIGLENMILGFNKKIILGGVTCLFLLCIFPDLLHGGGETTWDREMFGFLTERQNDTFRQALNDRGYQVTCCERIGVNGAALGEFDLYVFLFNRFLIKIGIKGRRMCAFRLGGIFIIRWHLRI